MVNLKRCPLFFGIILYVNPIVRKFYSTHYSHHYHVKYGGKGLQVVDIIE